MHSFACDVKHSGIEAARCLPFITMHLVLYLFPADSLTLSGWFFDSFQLILWLLAVDSLIIYSWFFDSFQLILWLFPVDSLTLSSWLFNSFRLILWFFPVDFWLFPVGSLTLPSWLFYSSQLILWQFPVDSLTSSSWFFDSFRLNLTFNLSLWLFPVDSLTLSRWFFDSSVDSLTPSSWFFDSFQLILWLLPVDFPRREGRGYMMSPPCLESQGFQFDPTFLYIISSFVLLHSLVALSVLSFSAFGTFSWFIFPQTSIFRKVGYFVWLLLAVRRWVF